MKPWETTPVSSGDGRRDDGFTWGGISSIELASKVLLVILCDFRKSSISRLDCRSKVLMMTSYERNLTYGTRNSSSKPSSVCFVCLLVWFGLFVLFIFVFSPTTRRLPPVLYLYYATMI
mmetsp:Transcript_11667/g.18061  ORF Transcript_11667/g.18061 Transcript_11667/m.18061 type:complete len:119 (+) Transcript_11667:88-444(+)